MLTRKIFYAGFIFAGLFLLALGALAAYQEIRLRTSFRTIDAAILDVRESDNGGYEGQYQFTVNQKSYSYADITGRRDLWVSIPSFDTSSIKVIYSPDNPWINRPYDSSGDPLAGPLVGAGAGLVLFIAGLFAFTRIK